MKLYLLRHTRPDVQDGICYGQTDIAPSQSFRDETDNIKLALLPLKFSAIYSSPLKRCSMLAETINNTDFPVVYDERLMELNFGDWELKKWNNIELTIEARKWFADYINFSCPGGESYRDLLNRVQNFISDLKKKNDNQPVLVVCHAGVIKSFNALINKIDINEALKLNVGYGEIIEMNLN